MFHIIFKNIFQMQLSPASAVIMLFGAFLTAFLVAVAAGTPLIKRLSRHGMIERTEKTPIEDEKVRSGIKAKKDIPTMGGVIIGLGLAAGTLLWADLKSPVLWLCLACFSLLGAVGMVDDYLKTKGSHRWERGLKVRYKLLLQCATGSLLGLVYWTYVREPLSGLSWPVPGHVFLLSDPLLWLGSSALVVALLSNAVNVSDGMDGLAGGLSIAALLPLALLAAFLSPAGLFMSGGVALFCAALAGAILGFLWHNIYPARVFMGDTGALAIGGSFGLAALLSGFELLLPVLAFVFLVEFASSVIQVLAFRATGRRLFTIAPLHHLFQIKKWPEMHTVGRFWIAGIICSLTTLLLAALLNGIK